MEDKLAARGIAPLPPRRWALALLPFALAACTGRREPPNTEPTRPVPKSLPAPAASATAAASSGTSSPPTPPPSAKSKVPTLDEWRTAKVEALGGAPLGCEGRSVREWVRVSCRGTDPALGAPTSVTIARQGGGETYTFSKDGVASLVARFLPGTDAEATFAWSGGTHHALALGWPASQPERPAPIATFTDAPPNVGGIDEALRRAGCTCYRKTHGSVPSPDNPCDGFPPDTFPAECLRAQVGNVDCLALAECMNFAPTGLAKCLDDEVYVSPCPSCRCAKACGPGKPPCPKGEECQNDGWTHNHPACVAP